MRDITVSEMGKIYKLISKIPFSKVSGEYTFCFTIEDDKKVLLSEGGLIIGNPKKEQGYSALVKPCFTFANEHDEEIRFSYATTEYAIPFDIEKYIDAQFFPVKLKKKEMEELKELNCYLISEKNILVSFPYSNY